MAVARVEPNFLRTVYKKRFLRCACSLHQKNKFGATDNSKMDVCAFLDRLLGGPWNLNVFLVEGFLIPSVVQVLLVCRGSMWWSLSIYASASVP